MSRKFVVNGKEITLELRYCLNKRCDSVFWTNQDSKQGICSITCWEIVNNNILPKSKAKAHSKLPFYPDTGYKREQEMSAARERRMKYRERIDKAVKKTLKG